MNQDFIIKRDSEREKEFSIETALEHIKNTSDAELIKKIKEFPKEKLGNKDWLVPIIILLESIYSEFRDISILDIGGGHIGVGEKTSIYPIPETIKKDKDEAMDWLKQNWDPKQETIEAPTLSAYLSLKGANMVLLDPEANTDIPFWQAKKNSIFDKNIDLKNDFDVVISSKFFPPGPNRKRAFRKMIKRAYEFTNLGGINIFVTGDDFGKNVLNNENFLRKVGFDIIKTFEYEKYKIALLYKKRDIKA